MVRQQSRSGFVSRSQASTSEKQVLTQSDFTYLGMLRVPTTDPTASWGYSHTSTITTRRVGGNLHILSAGAQAGFRQAALFETVYETPGMDQATSPRMDMYLHWGEGIYDNRRVMFDTSNGIQTTGFCWDDETGMLLWCLNPLYSAEHIKSIGATELSPSAIGNTYGTLRTTCHSKQANGSLCLIPTRHRSAMNGMTALFGAQQASINFLNTWGFSANSFDHTILDGATPDSTSDFNDQSIVTEEIMKSRLEHKMNRDATCQECLRGEAGTGYDCNIGPTTIYPANNSMTYMDSMHGIVWIDNETKHGIVCTGMLCDRVNDAAFRAAHYNGDNLPHYWYSTVQPTCCHGHTSNFDGTGPHTSSLVAQMWIWDPQLFLDVAAGTRTPQSIANMPSTKHLHFYDMGATTFPKHVAGSSGGIAYDPVDRLLIVAAGNQDTTQVEAQTVFHVFQVAA